MPQILNGHRTHLVSERVEFGVPYHGDRGPRLWNLVYIHHLFARLLTAYSSSNCD
jgi:hypothetical protein